MRPSGALAADGRSDHGGYVAPLRRGRLGRSVTIVGPAAVVSLTDRTLPRPARSVFDLAVEALGARGAPDSWSRPDADGGADGASPRRRPAPAWPLPSPPASTDRLLVDRDEVGVGASAASIAVVAA